MPDGDRWWIVGERPFHSDLPLIGPLVVWFRRAWNNIATRWYVLPLLEQQNAVNASLVETLAELREELDAVQAILVDLDREAQTTRRDQAGAIYQLNAEVERLAERLDGLDPPAPPTGKGSTS